MTIPKDLTYEEIGALLVAVGKHMIDHDVCAEAVLDHMPIELCDELGRSMSDEAWSGYLDRERAEHLLRTLTLQEAIAYNHLDKP